jgi:hypothetical protein
VVITREIQGYVSRDWAAARSAKDEFWAARIARLGPIEGLRIADELRRQVVRQNPIGLVTRNATLTSRLTQGYPSF